MYQLSISTSRNSKVIASLISFCYLLVLQGKVVEGTEESVDWSFAVLELLREEQGLDIKEINNRYNP